MKVQAYLNEHVKGTKFRKRNKIPRTSSSVLTYVFGHNNRKSKCNNNILLPSSYQKKTGRLRSRYRMEVKTAK